LLIKKPFVSIIVPVYNVEEYIKECLVSIRNQTLKDIEIIIVNDGSTDNSINIVKKEKLHDSRIKIITQSNKGLSEARNTGIRHSKGEYISFVDSDDYISEKMIEVLYSTAKENDCDIVSCQYAQFADNLILYESKENKFDINFENILLRKVPPIACNRLYKTSLFIDYKIKFPKNIYHEDVATTFKLYFFSKKTLSLDETFYYWRKRANSISNSFSKKHVKSLFKIIKIKEDFLLENNIEKQYLDKTLLFYQKAILEIFYFIFDTNLNEKDIKIIFKYLYKKINKSSIFGNLRLLKELDYISYKKIHFELRNKELYLNCKNSYKLLYSLFATNIKRRKELNNINSKKYIQIIRSIRYRYYNHNLDFSTRLNTAISFFKEFITSETKVAIYGNSIIGRTISNEFLNNISVIIDKNPNFKSSFSTCSISDAHLYNFDIIIIAVLGREKIIKREIKKNLNLRNIKILTFPIQ
jgi:glycosyltransferase involved in cell wall biosynthesis